MVKNKEIANDNEMPVRMELKPERVQLLLLGLPNWKLREDGRAIETDREFTTEQAASSFAALACRLARVQRQPLGVMLSGKQVLLTLTGHPVRGCTGGLTSPVFKLAELIAA